MGATGLATTPAEYRGRLLEQPDEQLDAWAAEAMRDISIRRGVLAVLHDVRAASGLDDRGAGEGLRGRRWAARRGGSRRRTAG